MGDTWYTNLNVFLDEDGNIAAPKGPARNLAEHIVTLVAMASRPELIPLPEYEIRCRRRPGRKPCPGIIEADFDPEDYRIMWWCPVCEDMASDDDVLVSGFGKFFVKEKQARKGRNPYTGEDAILPARRVVTFKCSGLLREKVYDGNKKRKS